MVGTDSKDVEASGKKMEAVDGMEMEVEEDKKLGVNANLGKSVESMEIDPTSGALDVKPDVCSTTEPESKSDVESSSAVEVKSEVETELMSVSDAKSESKSDANVAPAAESAKLGGPESSADEMNRGDNNEDDSASPKVKRQQMDI